MNINNLIFSSCLSSRCFLINLVKNQAKKENISLVSLTVWNDNITAIQFYKHQDFRETKHINVAFHPLMPHHDGMSLIQCLL